MPVKFSWDDHKNRSNFKKHGVWFEEAQTIWADGKSLEFFDFDHSEDEDRYLRVGLSARLNVLLVVFCEHQEGELIYIISARKATKKEKEQYEKRI